MPRHEAIRPAALFCIASGAAFGAMAVFGKLAYDEGATVGTLLAVRFTLAAALFWVLVPLREFRALAGRDVRTGLVLGALGYALQAGCYFVALDRIDASLLALLLYTFPALVAAAAVAHRARAVRRPPRDRRLPRHRRARRWPSPAAGDGALDPVGVALGLGAAVVYSVYILVSDGIAGRVPPAGAGDARLHRRGGHAADRLRRCSASCAPAT